MGNALNRYIVDSLLVFHFFAFRVVRINLALGYAAKSSSARRMCELAPLIPKWHAYGGTWRRDSPRSLCSHRRGRPSPCV
jgi:hypothetical protein